MAKRTDRRLSRQRARRAAQGDVGGKASGDKARRDGFDVTFDTGDLPGEQGIRMTPQLQSRREQRRRVDVCVAVDLAKAHKLGVLEAWNQPQNPRLLGESQVVLEADQVVAIGSQVLLPKLHDSIRSAAGSRIVEPHWLHRSEAQSVPSTPREL